MSFVITPSQIVIHGGGKLLFNVSTDMFAAGTALSYRITGLSFDDVQGGALSGTTVIDSTGNALIEFRLAADTQADVLRELNLEITGIVRPDAAALDASIKAFMAKYSVPGLSLGIAYQDELVYANGYGFADLSTQETVSPESLFRLASVSKSFTAAVVLDLVEAGRISLDQPAFALLEVVPVSGTVWRQGQDGFGLITPPVSPRFPV